jgi:hypothetical protein
MAFLKIPFANAGFTALAAGQFAAGIDGYTMLAVDERLSAAAAQPEELVFALPPSAFSSDDGVSGKDAFGLNAPPMSLPTAAPRFAFFWRPSAFEAPRAQPVEHQKPFRVDGQVLKDVQKIEQAVAQFAALSENPKFDEDPAVRGDFQRLVLDPLAGILEEAQTDMRWHVPAVLDLMFTTPTFYLGFKAQLRPFSGAEPPLADRSKAQTIARVTYGTETPWDDMQQALQHLHSLVFSSEDRVVLSLGHHGMARLFRVLRQALKNGVANEYVIFLFAQADSVEALMRIMTVIESLGAMSWEQCMEISQKIPSHEGGAGASLLDEIEALLTAARGITGRQACTLRLEAFKQQVLAPSMVVGFRALEAALSSLPETADFFPVANALERLEAAVKGDAETPEEVLECLAKSSMGLFPFDEYNVSDAHEDVYAEDLFRSSLDPEEVDHKPQSNLEQWADLFLQDVEAAGVPEVLFHEILLTETAHADWRFRFAIARTLRAIEPNDAGLELLSRARGALQVLGKDESDEVMLEAFRGLVRLYGDEVDTKLQGRMRDAIIGKFEAMNITAAVKATDYLNEVWDALRKSDRVKLLRAAEKALYHEDVDAQQQAVILAFLSKHASELSKTGIARMSRDVELATRAMQALRDPEPWLEEYASPALTFLCQVVGGKPAEYFEMFALQGQGHNPVTLALMAELFAARSWNTVTRIAILKKAIAAIWSVGDPAVGSLRFMLGHARQVEREAALHAFIQELYQELRSGIGTDSLRDYLFAFVNIASELPEWQVNEGLALFIFIKQEIVDVRRLRELAEGLPKGSYMPFYYALMAAAGLSGDNNEMLIVRHLFASCDSPGVMQQVAAFMREYFALSQHLRSEFAKDIVEQSRSTQKGKARFGDDIQRIQLNPARAQSRLRSFMIDRFAAHIALTSAQKNAIRAGIQGNIRLWRQGDLVNHLASLASFSQRAGMQAIRDFVMTQISPAVVQASAAAGNRRFVNPGRYKPMEGAFSPQFIASWGNQDHDVVIPMGELNDAGELRKDPLALRKALYAYAARQMATHLGIPGVSHIEDGMLASAIRKHVREIAGEEGMKPFVSAFSELLRSMGDAKEIGDKDLEALLRLADQADAASALGTNSREVLSDLKELKRGLTQDAVNGQAWLVITSNPADIVGSGRFPVTCQDPTRNTGHNTQGQPVNRASDGRFLYAKVVVAKNVHVVGGACVASDDAVQVARAHIEATTESGERDSASRPHVLAERAYVHPGFIYKQQFGKALNAFARQQLGLNPKDQVHIQFTDQNMANAPQPLEDDRAIYRDTFHRRG